MPAPRRHTRIGHLSLFLCILVAVSLLSVAPLTQRHFRCLSPLLRQLNCSFGSSSGLFIDSIDDRSAYQQHNFLTATGSEQRKNWLPLARLEATATNTAAPIYVDLLLAKGGEVAEDEPIINHVLTADGWFDMQLASKLWDGHIGCPRFTRHVPPSHSTSRDSFDRDSMPPELRSSLQAAHPFSHSCHSLVLHHVHCHVTAAGWMTANWMQGWHSCACGMTCQLTWAPHESLSPDALIFVHPRKPPPIRQPGRPLRVYLNLEGGHNWSVPLPPFVALTLTARAHDVHARADSAATAAGARSAVNADIASAAAAAAVTGDSSAAAVAGQGEGENEGKVMVEGEDKSGREDEVEIEAQPHSQTVDMSADGRGDGERVVAGEDGNEGNEEGGTDREGAARDSSREGRQVEGFQRSLKRGLSEQEGVRVVRMDPSAGSSTDWRLWDIGVGYHVSADVQVTYHTIREGQSYFLSPLKRQDVPLYVAVSNCAVDERESLRASLLHLLPAHSFGGCDNNVGGRGRETVMYPQCKPTDIAHDSVTWRHVSRCTMSHYKFSLAVENQRREGYVTEKLFDALDAGSVPIYLGAPDIHSFAPPNSFIDVRRFDSPKQLAAFILEVHNDPVKYMSFHAWRHCGVPGNYSFALSLSRNDLPCRICERVSAMGGRKAKA